MFWQKGLRLCCATLRVFIFTPYTIKAAMMGNNNFSVSYYLYILETNSDIVVKINQKFLCLFSSAQLGEFLQTN